MSDKVYIERPEVTAEREAGWVNFHPEDICHACGGDNPRWHADPEQWYQAMDVRDTDAGGIVCPNCFIALWHDTTDREVIWHLSIMEVTSSDIGPTSSDIERDSEGVGDCARCNGFGVIPGETSRDLPPLCPVCDGSGNTPDPAADRYALAYLRERSEDPRP